MYLVHTWNCFYCQCHLSEQSSFHYFSVCLFVIVNYFIIISLFILVLKNLSQILLAEYSVGNTAMCLCFRSIFFKWHLTFTHNYFICTDVEHSPRISSPCILYAVWLVCDLSYTLFFNLLFVCRLPSLGMRCISVMIDWHWYEKQYSTDAQSHYTILFSMIFNGTCNS